MPNYLLTVFIDSSSTNSQITRFRMQASAHLPGGGKFSKGIMLLINLSPANIPRPEHEDAFISLPTWYFELLLDRIQLNWTEWSEQLEEERILC